MLEYRDVFMLTLSSLAIYVVTLLVRLGALRFFEAFNGQQGLKGDSEILRIGSGLTLMGLIIYLGLSVNKSFTHQLVFPNPLCLAGLVILFGVNYCVFLSLAQEEVRTVFRNKRKKLAFSWLLGFTTLSLAGMTILGK